MPYHKDKQQAFQAAQQGVDQAIDVYNDLVKNDPDYGRHLKELKNEINEAFQQIDNALEVASENQLDQLRKFKNDLESIVSRVDFDE
ncbi:hypothetical protein [Calidifontibacillus erzurumensis]|uniref:Small, acid-soluble spore protein N n=1 Tax=Calidifontibacillus erzurumensis TaxID=2741433 RepID=A0A8J8KDU4_9BACI|nr:hypothetical protein [Calidifontibacillus erzurumensis]NSL51070.1 hypothetical protein [Calidifontibacillus erzurumensis]